jgi:hypothetical protein
MPKAISTECRKRNAISGLHITLARFGSSGHLGLSRFQNLHKIGGSRTAARQISSSKVERGLVSG